MCLLRGQTQFPLRLTAQKAPLRKQTCDGQKTLGQECFHSNDQQIMTLVRTHRTCEVKLIRGVNLPESGPALHRPFRVNIGFPVHLSSDCLRNSLLYCDMWNRHADIFHWFPATTFQLTRITINSRKCGNVPPTSDLLAEYYVLNKTLLFAKL